MAEARRRRSRAREAGSGAYEERAFTGLPIELTPGPDPASLGLPFAPAVTADPAKTAATSASPEKAAPPADHKGHRKRVRRRFDHDNGVSFDDYELLELLLFRTIPRDDTKPIAKALLRQFGSIGAVLHAPAPELKKVNGVGDQVVHDFRLAAAVAQRIGRQSIEHRNVLSSWADVVGYCRTAMAHAEREEFRILFLDKKNHLIRDEVQQHGTVDHTPVYPREVVKRALELSASALILVHNHPSGDPSPSRADITMTKQIVDVAGPLGITVHDHLIVGRTAHISLRAANLM